MALAPCRECGKEVSSETKACPSCGMPANKSTNSGMLTALAAIAITGALIGATLLTNSGLTSEGREQAACENTEAAYQWLQDEIRSSLTSPSSAVFPSLGQPGARGIHTTSFGPCVHSILAYYDSSNVFGAMIRSDIISFVQYEGAGRYSIPSNNELEAKLQK